MIRLKFARRQDAFRLDVEAEIPAGAFVAVFGPSGAGKSTLLRCLAGLARPDDGYLSVDGEVWYDSDADVEIPIQQRQVGFMFQDYALFPNMTVRGNLEFALRRGADRRRVDALLGKMQLGELQHRKPAQLSGGQKQRVALARALASEPQMLLLDEPLSALDQAIRLELQDELLAMHRAYGLTTLMVSHDVGEVYRLAERVLVMDGGRIVRSGNPAEVFVAGAESASGKFRFSGEVLAVEPVDVVFAVTVLVGNQIVRVVATADEARRIKPGSRVLLLSKAFNPMLQVID